MIRFFSLLLLISALPYSLQAGNNYTPPERPALILSLEKGDTFVLFFHSTGCFHDYSDSIFVYYSGDVPKVHLWGDDGEVVKVLDSSILQGFINLEMEAKKNWGDGCTTVDSSLFTFLAGSIMMCTTAPAIGMDFGT